MRTGPWKSLATLGVLTVLSSASGAPIPNDEATAPTRGPGMEVCLFCVDWAFTHRETDVQCTPMDNDCSMCDSPYDPCHLEIESGKCDVHPACQVWREGATALLNAVDEHNAVDVNRILAKNPDALSVNHSRGMIQFLYCVGAIVGQIEVDSGLLSQLP